MNKVLSMQDAAVEDNHQQQCEVCGWRDCTGHELSPEPKNSVGDKDTGIRTQLQLEAELHNMTVFLEETKAELARVTQELLKANNDHVALEGEIEKLKDKLIQVQTYALSKCQESDFQGNVISAYQKQRSA